MLKHVLQYLLIIAAFVSLPFVLYFAIVAFGDVATEAQQEQETPEPVSPPPGPAVESPSTTPPPTAVPSDDTPGEGSILLDIDEVGAAFWLKRRDDGMYDAVANLSWVADGVDEIEEDPVMVLIELGLDEPLTASHFIETSWFNDGLTEDEAWAFTGATYIDSFVSDGSMLMRQLPWVVDGISKEESWALSSLADISDESDEAAIALMSKTWFGDGITEDESEALGLIAALSYKTGSASEFISMPFLESVEEADVLALASLYQLALLNWVTLTSPSEFDQLIAHPDIADGISDEEAVFVTLASNAYEFNPALAETLLDPSEIKLETRTVHLPLSGETVLMVVRTQSGSETSLDLLEASVRFVENYMDEPLPVSLVLLLYADAVESGFAGHNSGTAIVVHPDFDKDDDSFEALEAEFIISHEVSHFYWRASSHDWIHEGAAEFLSIAYAEDELGVYADELLADFSNNFDCIEDMTLSTLETLNSPQTDDCAYELGLMFYWDLRLALGHDDFQRGFRELYETGKDVWDPDSPEAWNITHIREAFGFNAAETENVIEKWYAGK